MVTTAEYIQNGQASLLAFQNALNNLNQALTSLGVTNLTVSPTVAVTAASIAATPITSVN